MDSTGRVLEYASEWARQRVEAAAEGSPDLRAELDHFMQPGNKEGLLIGEGDVPDTKKKKQLGDTQSMTDPKTGEYLGAIVRLDRKDIENSEGENGEPIDPRTVGIHEIVGHVRQDRLGLTKGMSEDAREERAKEETARALRRWSGAKCPPPIPPKVVPKPSAP